MVAGLVWFEFFGAVVIYSVFFNGPRSPTKIHPQLRNLRKIPPPPETSEMITGCLRKIHLNSEISEKYTPNSEISEKYTPTPTKYTPTPKSTPPSSEISENNTPPPETSETNMPLLR